MEIKLSDLMSNCEKCDGAGKLENPALANQSGSFGQRRVTWATPVDCATCNGKGVILTESGTVLLNFVQKLRERRFLTW